VSRIEPLSPPYPPEIQASFDVIMRGAPPLMLFRTVGRNARVLSRLMAGGLLDRGSVSVRQRELMILRVTARARAEYEWGVHVAAYGKKAGFSEAELHSTVHGGAADACWKPDEAAIVKLADAACDTGDVSDPLWAELKKLFSDEQLVELVQLAGNYRSIAFTLNALRVPLEPSAPRYPAR
jgi:alkylhydroperoxidase family enzyme